MFFSRRIRENSYFLLLIFTGTFGVMCGVARADLGNVSPSVEDSAPLDFQNSDENPSISFPSNAGSTFAADRYILGSSDLVEMNIFGIPEYSQQYRVLSDGTLNLPLIGTLAVEGLSLERASALIQSEYARYVRDPFVSLTLVQLRPLRIAIAGEVYRPGSYEIEVQSNNDQRPQQGSFSVTEAIQLAGGITQSADIRQIQIRRTLTAQNSPPQIVDVNLWQLLQQGELSEDVVLRDGDTVIVPTANSIEANELTEIATASFSPDTITVYVAGEVESPGPVQVSPNTPLNQALLAAGGFNNRSNRNRIEFLRLNPDGTVSQREINVDFSQGANEVNNPALRNNDTIVVSRSGASAFSDAASPFLGPLGGILGLFNFIRND